MTPGRSLPNWNTVFLGRDAELAAVADLVASRRVTTFTGAGGCGKTRLAVVLAERIAACFDRVAFVDLAPASAADVLDVVRENLGALERTGAAVLDLIVEDLGERRTLFVLDNCEHVVDVAADLVDRLWRACPGTTVLATSREPLRIEGEATYRVPSLAVPVDDADLGAASVRMFADRASLARAPGGFPSREWGAVLEICRFLDGIPLAIELAAAGCRTLTPAQILGRLRDGLETGQTSHRSARARHLTLRASIEWSYRQLCPDEQRIARALSVFAGGFSLEGAGAVCDPADAAVAAAVVATLVDRSLLEPAAGDPARFRLLQTIRQFLAAELLAAGEGDAARARHARHLLAVVAEVGAGLTTAAYTTSAERLDVELPDLRLADDWLAEHGGPGAALELHAPLCLYWSRRHAAEGVRRAWRALRDGAGSDAVRAQVILTCMESAFFVGTVEEAMWAVLDEWRDIAERLPAGPAKGEQLTALGMLELCLLDDRGVPHIVESLAHLRPGGPSYRLVDCLWNLGFVAMWSGNLATSTERFGEAMAESEALGHPYVLGMSPALLGTTLAMAGSHEAAEPLLRGGIEILQAAGDRCIVHVARAALARLRAARGEPAEALVDIARVRAAALRDGQGWAMGWSWWAQVVVEGGILAANEPFPALEEAEEVMAAEGGTWLWGVAWCRALRAERLAARGELTAAWAMVADVGERVGHSLAGRAGTAFHLARARVGRAAGHDALPAAHDALRAAVGGGMVPETLEALELIALLSVERGEAVVGTRMLAACGAMREGAGWVALPTEQRSIARTGELARIALEPSDFAEAWAQGAALSLDEAVAYATRGRGERKRPPVGWASLTPAELGVVALAARGLRNAEIAATLFTSTATVKTHLTRIFRKLGVATRAELAAVVAERRGDQPKV